MMGENVPSEELLQYLADSAVKVTNSRLIRRFYAFQNSSQLLISKLTNLIYDGLREKNPGSSDKYVKEYALESEKPWAGFLLPEEVQ